MKLQLELFDSFPGVDFFRNFKHYNHGSGIFPKRRFAGEEHLQRRNHFMTYCNNSYAGKSKLVVRDIPIAHPEINPEGSSKTNINLPGFQYSVSDGTLILTTYLDGSCDRCGNPVSVSRIKNLLQEIADGTVLLPADDADERLLVMQQQLYDLLKANPNLVLNDTTLQQFIYDNQWSNLDFIYYAARYVAEGRWDLVQMLLGAWPGQTNLDEAYRKYFEWLKDMHDIQGWLPNTDEVRELANKCPLKYGTIIYAVRNLYNALTGDINKFENNCEENAGAKGTKQLNGFIRLKQPKIKSEPNNLQLAEKNMIIYPNPTSGIINIIYHKIKQISIIDAMGRVVLTDSWDGNNNKVHISINNLPRGLYIIKAINADNKIQSKKLIKNGQ